MKKTIFILVFILMLLTGIYSLLWAVAPECSEEYVKSSKIKGAELCFEEGNEHFRYPLAKGIKLSGGSGGEEVSETTFSLTYSAGSGGSITGSLNQTVDEGNNGTEVTANPDAGYNFDGWSDGINTASRTDSNVISDVNVTASFSAESYTLTYNTGVNGSLTGTTSQTVNHGGSGVAVTAEPDSGYVFVDWSDGETDNPRTDTNVTGNISVTANFDVNEHLITTNVGVGGSINPENPSVTDGQTQEFTITADPNYEIDTVSGCNGTLSGNTYTTEVITSPCTVDVIFAEIEATDCSYFTKFSP